MSVDDRMSVVLCNSEEPEDVRHFLIRCEEFASERQRLLDKIDQVEGTEEWLEEYYRAEDEGKTALLLGRRVEGMADQVVARVNDCMGCGGGDKVLEETEEFEVWGGLKYSWRKPPVHCIILFIIICKQ